VATLEKLLKMKGLFVYPKGKSKAHDYEVWRVDCKKYMNNIVLTKA